MKYPKILKRISAILRGYFQHFATEQVEFDLIERKNLMGIFIISSLTGIPIAPSGICLELLPYMEEKIIILLSRLQNLDDEKGIIGGRFDMP